MRRENLRVLVVDDEPEARDLLTMMLGDFPGVELTGTAGGVDEAVHMMDVRQPDLVLLDIQMPGKTGFDFVKIMDGRKGSPGIIFVTAFDEYAIQAIKVSAFDYLLKPVDPLELSAAIERWRKQNAELDMQKQFRKLLSAYEGNRIKVNTRTGFLLLNLDDLVYCEAAGNYTRIFLKGGRQEMLTTNLGNFFDRLPAGRFFRISRSAVINLHYLSKVNNKDGTCVLDPGGQVVLSVARNKRADLYHVCASL